ncbi:uncharacterized protein [Misgurnus anguillicaudatus]|uniref:uncharacterized protein n=1 Tax=Misgurnus anguillicaudatus TaxID=75329 RepID=UPI003CCF435F
MVPEIKPAFSLTRNPARFPRLLRRFFDIISNVSLRRKTGIFELKTDDKITDKATNKNNEDEHTEIRQQATHTGAILNISPIQCRKLLNAWQNEEKTTCLTLTPVEPSEIFFSPTTEESLSSEFTDTSTTPSLPSSNSSSKTLDLNAWPENFIVPWNQMPAGIKTAIAQGKRPTAKDRREMVRIIINEMRLTELNPSKSQCLTVAKMIVKQHPESFADVMRDGTVIGSGYGSLLSQLKTRVEHVNRGSVLSRRRMLKRVPNSAADMPRGPVDQYGCVRWQLDGPQGETEESLKEKQSEMKDLYRVEGPAGADRGYLSKLMETTYFLQRKTINASPPPSIAELKNEWPYLFTPKELYSHFKLLTDIVVLDKMEEAMEKKGKLILQFFEQKPAGTNADEVNRILGMYNREEKCDPWPVIILLLMAHFKETSKGLFLQADASVILLLYYEAFKIDWYKKLLYI